jgi:hypothetical protein
VNSKFAGSTSELNELRSQLFPQMIGHTWRIFQQRASSFCHELLSGMRLKVETENITGFETMISSETSDNNTKRQNPKQELCLQDLMLW